MFDSLTPLLTDPAAWAALTARAEVRQRLEEALRDNNRALALAQEDSPEEDAAALMVAMYQRKLRRHDAETAALDGPSPPAPSPQIRRTG